MLSPYGWQAQSDVHSQHWQVPGSNFLMHATVMRRQYDFHHLWRVRGIRRLLLQAYSSWQNYYYLEAFFMSKPWKKTNCSLACMVYLDIIHEPWLSILKLSPWNQTWTDFYYNFCSSVPKNKDAGAAAAATTKTRVRLTHSLTHTTPIGVLKM